MVKFNPGLSQIFSKFFYLRTWNWSLQDAVQPLLRDTVTIKQSVTPSNAEVGKSTKMEWTFSPGLALIGLSGTEPRTVFEYVCE